MNAEREYISEAITPDPGTADTFAMARGLAGLPSGFTWRGQHYKLGSILKQWKCSEPEGHRQGAERYYRKHYFQVRVDSGQTMTLYVVRHTKSGEPPKRRWWLFTIDQPER